MDMSKGVQMVQTQQYVNLVRVSLLTHSIFNVGMMDTTVLMQVFGNALQCHILFIYLFYIVHFIKF